MAIQRREIIDRIKQHKALPIMVMVPNAERLSEDIVKELNRPVNQGFYSIMYVEEGSSTHLIDFREHKITKVQMIFVTPWQIHNMKRTDDTLSYGTSFGADIMNFLPVSYPFLANPFFNPVIRLSAEAAKRIIDLFSALDTLLKDKNSRVELVLAYLNALLTECNFCYFEGRESVVGTSDSLKKFIAFKNYLEDNYLSHPSVEDMAAHLAMNKNTLYHLVKSRCNHSPKDFLTARLMLEAKRRLYLKEPSIKQLAYSLNFNDPEYFSRLFKKNTGYSIQEYKEKIKDMSGF